MMENYRITYVTSCGRVNGEITVDGDGVPLKPCKDFNEEVLLETMVSSNDIEDLYYVPNGIIMSIFNDKYNTYLEYEIDIELLEPSNSPIYHNGEVSYFKPVSLDEFKKAYERNKEYKQSVFKNKGTNKVVFSKGLCFYSPHKKA